MFEVDEALDTSLETAQKNLEKAARQERDLRNIENQEWSKFFALVRDFYHAIGSESIKSLGQSLHYLVYENDSFIVAYSISEVTIFHKEKAVVIPTSFWRKEKISRSLRKIVELERSSSSYNDCYIKEIDYQYAAEYEVLFKELKVAYLDAINKKTYNTETDVAFRKLSRFEDNG